jgi:hypothetical protein
MDNRVKILVACHKPSPIPQNDMLMPIHVGSKCSQFVLDMQRDDEGENISEKNYCYCELTALYWAWRNLKDVDVIGLCHYRRYFDFHKQCIRFLPDTSFPVSSINELEFDLDNDLIDSVLRGRIVVPKAISWNCSLKQQYCEGHLSDDFKTLQRVVFKTQKVKYKKAFMNVFVKGYRFRPYNMMVMRWEDFDEYCSWLFELLFQVEDLVDISHYSTYQKRIFGFMSEYLQNVWLNAEKKQIIESPIMFMDEYCQQRFPRRFAPRKTIKLLKSNIDCAIINHFYKNTIHQ